MFRVKLSVPPERILPVIERIKTGIRGVGYVRLDDSAAWPERLDRPFPGPTSASTAAAGKPVGANGAEGLGAPTAQPGTPAP
jgi:HlyD family secretion protein